MSSSAKRMQKLRQGQSDEKAKARSAIEAQRNRDKRAAAKNAKIKDSQQHDQKSPHESSSLSLGADDSGFDTMNALEATSISSQCATTMTPVRGSSFRGSRKGSFFAQHDNRDSQFSCGDAANVLYTMRNFHYFDFQNISYKLRFKRLRAYFSKPSNMLHVSKCK